MKRRGSKTSPFRFYGQQGTKITTIPFVSAMLGSTRYAAASAYKNSPGMFLPGELHSTKTKA
jgi:hypothetical protein